MKLLLLTACDRVIQDLQYGNTLVSVFHAIKFGIPEEPGLPEDAVIPKEWALFSKWELLAEEENKPYVSLLEIFWPNGQPFLNYRLPAAQPTKDGMSFVSRMNGFPIGQNGKLRVVQSLELDGVVVYGPSDLEIQIAKVILSSDPHAAALP